MYVLILILMLNAGNVKDIDFMIFDNKSINVYEISYLSGNEINKRLKYTFLEGCGDMMYMIEKEKGINFRAVYAIAALESGKGKECIAINNYCGIKNKENTGYREFDSRDECLIFLADILSSKFYRGRTLESIGIDYCPTDDEWSSKVKELMGEI